MFKICSLENDFYGALSSIADFHSQTIKKLVLILQVGTDPSFMSLLKQTHYYDFWSTWVAHPKTENYISRTTLMKLSA